MSANKLLEQYGCYTFNDEVMKNRLPEETYKAFHDSLEKGETLSKETASVIADAMKVWALELGATHFTHWFSPLTGLLAEKHDAFLEPDGDKATLEFSGKLLRKGESDASSFPSGGLRATFEARGYTAWDCTSPAFVKDGSLYIPTLFCSYNGEALDNKTPLLKSCDSLNKEAVRLLHLLGEDVQSVSSYVGAEQEYFLIPEELYQKRLDLRFTGRTLFGANPPKGQEMDDHYFGSIDKKIADFMKELDSELWKFGIPSKTKHNEAAPSQHEIACVYRKVNITTDNNLLLMQLLKDVAKKHGLRCLLHEKPFKGVNGSGKHNNWSVVTSSGQNLFYPGSEPQKNLPFLASLACIVKGVDEYADLLRLSIATPANDHRLGGDEAPPSIISMFLGERINEVISSLIEGKEIGKTKKARFQTGVSVIPDFAKDNTDRNRTSPFALTGKKFEFRGVGSSQPIGFVNTVLNAILAKEMKEMSSLIEQGNKPIDIIKLFLKEHQRIIFEGDGYSSSWEEEAKRRGLPCRKNTVEAIEVLKNKELTKMLVELEILSQVELDSRYEILLETYSKTIQVEGSTSLKMARNEIYPAIIKHLNSLSKTCIKLNELNVDNQYLLKEISELSLLTSKMKEEMDSLEECLIDIKKEKLDNYSKAVRYRDNIVTRMETLRKVVDTIETKVNKNIWPMPTYMELLFSI